MPRRVVLWHGRQGRRENEESFHGNPGSRAEFDVRNWRWLGALILVTTGLLSATGPVQAASNELVHPGSEPSTDGTTIVWVNQGVYAARLADQQPTLFTSDPTLVFRFPDVSGDLAVWEEDCSGSTCPPPSLNIRAKNLATGQTYAVATGYAPRISGTRVLYENGANLMLRDLATMDDPTTLGTVPSGWSIQDPRISGDRVAWAEVQGVSSWRVLTAIIGQSPVQLAEGNTIGFFGIDLSGDELVYVAGSGIQADNLATGVGELILTNPYDQQPTTNGRYVFWDRSNFGPGSNLDGQRHDVMGYDLQTQSSFTVTQNTGRNVSPVARGDALAWMHGDAPDTQIHAAPISAVLPSAAQPDPGTTSPDWIYFKEIQHYLSFGFKDFWRQSGGVPVFGFPLTAEFSDRSPGQSQMLTVQYLERQRFEYHPEFKGTPYEVELGRLGAEDAAQRGLTSTQPFLPLSNSISGCDHVVETQHNLCGAFLDYWHSHGLDLGDPGYSFRESLALFGYPISEPFIDPDSHMLVQYFERAVFEYHPDNPDPYKVELRRLGAEQFATRAW